MLRLRSICFCLNSNRELIPSEGNSSKPPGVARSEKKPTEDVAEDEDELEVLVVPLERDSTAAVSCLRFGTPTGSTPDDEAGTTAFELVIIFLLLLETHVYRHMSIQDG